MSWPSKSAPSTAPGSVKQRPDDALRRAADVVVEAEEDAVLAGERRNDDVDGDERPREAGERDRSAPASRRPRASAYQIPSPTIGSPISSPVDIASSRAERRTGRAARCRGTRRRRGRAGSRTSPDGSRRPRSSRPTDTRGTRARAAPAAARSRDGAGPSQNTGSAPSDDDRDLRERERERRGPDASRAARAARGTDRRARRGARSARRSRRGSISSGRPCAVLQTACTMFPRSNRPIRKFV